MKKILLVFVVSIVSHVTNAQSDDEIKLFDAGVSSLKGGRYLEAANTFTKVLNVASDSNLRKLSYIYRAFSYNYLGNYKKAIVDLDTAVMLDPNDIATFIDRGKAKRYANDNAGARKDFEFVISKDSTSEQGAAAYFYLGLLAYYENKLKESIGYFDKFILLQPNDPEAYFNRGAAKGRLIPMDIEGSISDYDKAIALDPNYSEAYANRGVMKINLLTTRGTVVPTKQQTKDACADLIKAKQLGNREVDDMIFSYCDK